MSNLTGKVAVVTGGSKGIGAGIAKSLGAAGATVVVNYASDKAGAEATVKAIIDAGGKAVTVQGDVSKAAEAQGIVAAAVKQYGQLDILVNNSGVYGFFPLEAITEDALHKQFSVNVFGLLLVTQAAAPHMKQGSSIINIGSVISHKPMATSTIYAATKGAVDAVTGALAAELGPSGIRVFSVNPGMIETEGTQSAGLMGSDFEKMAVGQTPLGRIGQPKDVGSIVAFLASEDAAWLTGDVLIASGGYR